EEGQAFIKNLNDTKLLLLSKIEAQSLLINDKTNKRDEAIIKSNIEKINDKIKLIDEAIETQNKNIDLLQRAREVMSDPK
ncbi:hypothetical protein, partial [Salmonella enterica]|uniref:hypothetical protein n=1 Tax=Salmonella enterica TaxID=28901 RepID=UPI003CE7C4BD